MRLACTGLLLVLAPIYSPAGDYNPLAVSEGKPVFRDFTVKDEKRTREIPIRVYLPKSSDPAPIVIFSHGLGGSREMHPYLGNHWANRGYVAVFPQHPGSDDSVWKDAPVAQRMAAMNKAASPQNLLLRVKDIPAVLDQLEVWAKTSDHPLNGRLDFSKVGMSGHSFGAVTTQAVSGQSAPIGNGFTDARIKAAVVMSPSAPRKGDPAKAFGKVNIPWLLMTGTKDTSPIGNIDLESRLSVYPALPKGGKYELVLDNAEHSAFTDRLLPGDKEKRNPNHHKVILALSTAFWDTYLRNDPAAKKWLDGDGPSKILEKNDKWQKK